SNADVPPAACSACFAAEIASPAQQAAVDFPALAGGYGSVALFKPETWDAVSQRNVDAALALLPATIRGQLGNPALGTCPG
ncbi:MAG: hypothetical protein ABI557_13000, partial [Aureliella sp.]